VYEGWNVPPGLRSDASKLIAYAPTREMAIARMLRALDEYFLGGIKTNWHSSGESCRTRICGWPH